ncbi:hypothetical protein BH11BAC6_BH11BAC6_09160 [soil metagenome]
MSNLIDILTGDVNISRNERIISVAGGAALVILGLAVMKKKAYSWAELATGAALIARGISGHCPVSAAMNRNTAVAEIADDAEDAFERLA